MAHYLIVEDHFEQAQALSLIIKTYQKDTVVDIVTSVSEALPLLNTFTFDLFFLDIQLSEKETLTGNGIELGKLLRTIPTYRETPIIYVTSFHNHINEAINSVHCYGFLQKPYTKTDVYKLLDSLSKTVQVSTLQLRTSEYIIREIPFSDLLHVCSKGRYLSYYTLNECHVSRQYTLQNLETILPDYFIRCHKSHLFNQHYFSSYDSVNQCILLNHYAEPIPVGRIYKDSIMVQNHEQLSI